MVYDHGEEEALVVGGAGAAQIAYVPINTIAIDNLANDAMVRVTYLRDSAAVGVDWDPMVSSELVSVLCGP
ncbi:MAG: hypothetical protein KC621_00905 [Myxococcales bacterium]|nr:hypothetical protein [Myxococcales bacterium]